MIKIRFKEEPYDFGEAGKQTYTTEAVVTLDDEASTNEVIIAMLRIMKLATYPISKENVQEAIDEYFDGSIY